jgi:hypothetical protein
LRKRLVRWFFRLSRAKTRRRYGPEYDELLDELIENGHAGWFFLWVDALRGVGHDRLATPTARRGAVAGVFVVSLGVWGVGQATWAAPKTSNPSAQVSLSGELARPIVQPVSRPSAPRDCPATVPLSSPLPTGVVVSPPSIVSSNLWGLSAAGRELSWRSCTYTVLVSPAFDSP